MTSRQGGPKLLSTLHIIMIRGFRIAYNISHLSFYPATIPHLQRFAENNSKQALKILNFDYPAQKPSFITRTFRQKPHAELLELYLEFVCRAEPAPKDIAYTSIEETLRNTVLDRLKQANTKVSIQRFKVLESIQVQKNEFRGVFIHRKLNLTNASYDITVHKTGSVSFQLKKSQRSDAVKEYEKMMRTYSSQKLQEIYCRSMQQFQREREITRQIYKVVADLVLCFEKDGKKVLMGGQGPTEHLLQVESVFNTSYNMHEHFLTDVDFLLKGNYFLRDRI